MAVMVNSGSASWKWTLSNLESTEKNFDAAFFSSGYLSCDYSFAMTTHESKGFTSGSLLKGLPVELPEERFDTLLEHSGFRLEKILSLGHTTPTGEWYDQENDEWILLVQGAAQLNIEGMGLLDLSAGDTVLLPAHCRHRVEWTDKSVVTVWLALHFQGQMAISQQD